MQITCALRISASNCSRSSVRAISTIDKYIFYLLFVFINLPEESMMCIVTFSGVTSGGIVTSGIRCWTYIIVNICNEIRSI